MWSQVAYIIEKAIRGIRGNTFHYSYDPYGNLFVHFRFPRGIPFFIALLQGKFSVIFLESNMATCACTCAYISGISYDTWKHIYDVRTTLGRVKMCKSGHIVRLTFHKSGNVYFKLTVTCDRSRQYFNFARYVRTIENSL